MKKHELEKLEFGNWPLPEKACTEIGRMHALWNSMENTLSLLIGKLAGYNDIKDMRPYILLNHTTFQEKLDIFGSLCDFLKSDYPHLSKYPQVISKLKTAQKQRNIFTHQTFIYNVEKDELELATSSTRGKLKTNVRIINVEEIKKAIIDIDEANVAMYELILFRKLKPVWKKIIDGEKKV
ncbi:MAG: hypothetical protein KDC88_07415 [Ignavibacteriae bacterium]|nr:hypothetical protein [Ignavibacteriota bacterium]MCB9211344.1 hypothetical protein [Ignavibacteriales bacterium]